jgi:hypothetical protein
MEKRSSPENAGESGPAALASFSSLVITLALSAMEQLGTGPSASEKAGAQPRPDQAKPIIDTLEVLKEKTRGNLTQDEAGLLDAVLLDLRLRYLKAAGSGGAGEATSPQAPGTEAEAGEPGATPK